MFFLYGLVGYAVALKFKIKNNLDLRNIKFVLPSEWMKDKLMESGLRIDSKNLVVIENPINNLFFTEKKINCNRKKYNINEDDFVCIFVSYWLKNPLKDLKDVIESLEVLSRISSRKITLICVGGYFFRSFKSNLINIISTNMVLDTEKMLEILDLADLNLSFSKAESFGLNVAECMARGIPSIVYRDTPMAKILEKNNLGVVVDNKEQMLSQLLKIINAGPLFNINSGKLREYAQNTFHPKIVSKRYFDFYKFIYKL